MRGANSDITVETEYIEDDVLVCLVSSISTEVKVVNSKAGVEVLLPSELVSVRRVNDVKPKDGERLRGWGSIHRWNTTLIHQINNSEFVACADVIICFSKRW